MQYAKKYPNAYEDDEVAEGISVMNKPGHCGKCGKETMFFDQSLNTFVCSEECETRLWENGPR